MRSWDTWNIWIFSCISSSLKCWKHGCCVFFFSSKDTFIKKRNALFWYNVFGIVGDGGGSYQRYDISSYNSTDPCFGNGSHTSVYNYDDDDDEEWWMMNDEWRVNHSKFPKVFLLNHYHHDMFDFFLLSPACDFRNPFATLLPMNLKDTDTPIPVEQLCDVKAFSLDKVARQRCWTRLEFENLGRFSARNGKHVPSLKLK